MKIKYRFFQASWVDLEVPDEQIPEDADEDEKGEIIMRHIMADVEEYGMPCSWKPVGEQGAEKIAEALKQPFPESESASAYRERNRACKCGHLLIKHRMNGVCPVCDCKEFLYAR